LHDTNLAQANLREAYIEESLVESVRTLEGATMPNGQPYEEGLKDKEGHREESHNMTRELDEKYGDQVNWKSASSYAPTKRKKRRRRSN
jgi:hypothetical protein